MPAETDATEPSSIAATSADGAEQRSGAAAEGEPAAQVMVPRRQRVSVVMWTAYTPQPAAAAPT